MGVKVNVTVTYVTQINIEDVPKEVVNELTEACENRDFIQSGSISEKYDNAMDWLADNTNDKDALDWSYEVDGIEEW